MLQAGKIVFVMLALWALTECATPNPNVLMLNNQNVSLIELKAMIKEVIPLGIRSISANGREFLSDVYIIQKSQYVAAKEAPTRYWARILILNEARPYDIEVEVRKEVRDDRGNQARYFYAAGSEVTLAKILRAQLKDRLAKRRDDLNLLDDFRVF
jgi:hypothetical protein